MHINDSNNQCIRKCILTHFKVLRFEPLPYGKDRFWAKILRMLTKSCLSHDASIITLSNEQRKLMTVVRYWNTVYWLLHLKTIRTQKKKCFFNMHVYISCTLTFSGSSMIEFVRKKRGRSYLNYSLPLCCTAVAEEVPSSIRSPCPRACLCSTLPGGGRFPCCWVHWKTKWEWEKTFLYSYFYPFIYGFSNLVWQWVFSGAEYFKRQSFRLNNFPKSEYHKKNYLIL